MTEFKKGNWGKKEAVKTAHAERDQELTKTREELNKMRERGEERLRKEKARKNWKLKKVEVEESKSGKLKLYK